MRKSSFSSNSFKLDEDFIAKFNGRQPEWGPLGYFTFKRTYSRNIEEEQRKEEFWETLRRVVEGCFSIQKNHCKKYMIPWDEDKGKESAEIMYDKMWNFKLLPPGRGLWIMGTKYIAEHGSAALNNCGFVSTKDIHLKYARSFEFLMDCLMLGVGVGFDTKGANKLKVKNPRKGNFNFKIPDSREGWVQSLRLMLEAYFLGKQIPIYDFSEIRPSGSPIRTFGGIAPGPAPLKKMLNNIQSILEEKVDRKLTSENIVDLMNQIGTCVVAGGIRRSAEIALGDLSDKNFIILKQDKEKLYSHRWVSNNSVIAKRGDDYSFISKQIAKNGEPGIFWLENARAYSRMVDPPDYKDKKASGINPCITGDTLIAVADGRNAVPIKQLAEEGSDVPIYCKNNNGLTVIRMMRNPRITGYNQKVYEVKLDDGSIIKCTDNHRFLMKNGSKIATINLKSGDSIMITFKWQITWADIMGGGEKSQNTKYWILNDGRKNILEYMPQKISNRSSIEELYNQERALELVSGELCNNNKIISVRFNGYSTVYNGTVDDYHNYGIILNEKQTKTGLPKLEMAFTANCGEQTLESFELCCLVETFPSRHATYEEYQETLKYAYLYAKSVTLLRTHWKLTNAVMMKNRRIGISQTGITEAFLKHGHYKMLEWCDKGYNYLKQLDEAYSKWLGIPTSIKLTTVKPSGTLSLLPGVSQGIHFPHAEYYIRRVRVSENADILNVVKAAGYNIVKDLYSDNTYVVEFPIHNLNIDRAKKEVSMWEQAENAALYQKYWSDNQVSITITFQRQEAKEIKYLLECFEDKLKCLSFLPFEEHGYKQAPYEQITKEKFDEMSANLSPLNFDKVKDREIGSLFCETDKCEIHIKRE